MNARLLFVHALSPLHAGTGQGVGVIDLPTAREKATGIPYLPGSSLKGVLRDACTDKEARSIVFGPDKASAHEHAGSVQISDQRLLLLPVRSLVGTFAWVTSPHILRRFQRDAQYAGMTDVPSDVPTPTSASCCHVADSECLIVSDGQVILEDLDLTSQADARARAWGEWIGRQVFAEDTEWRRALVGRFCIVHDDVMSLLLETATEVMARIRLHEEAKTVERGGLWYEEALPAETVLAGLVVATPVKAGPEKVFATIGELIASPLQLGGKATVGRGLCRLRLAGGDSRANA